MLALRSSATVRPAVACRASAPVAPVAVEVPVCPCVSAVDVFAAKDRCVHPDRPLSQACKDCPRRKGKTAVEMAVEPPVSAVQIFAAKDRCVHPDRPLSQACKDCPRRKGKIGAAAVAMLQNTQPITRTNLSVFAAKSKCVHPTRPVKDACPDCPRRRK